MNPFVVGFTDTIVRRRQMPGERNSYGEFVPGAVIDTELRASVQPLSVEDLDLVEGARLSERLKVFVPQPDALAAAFDDGCADQVVLGQKTYVVEESRSWASSHTRAILLRET